MSVDKDAAEGQLEDVANVLGDVARAMQRGQATPSLLAQAREQAGLNVAIAQARATLYLAEQQRIANLIAVATAEANLLDPLPASSPFVPVFEQIREGLGLS